MMGFNFHFPGKSKSTSLTIPLLIQQFIPRKFVPFSRGFLFLYSVSTYLVGLRNHSSVMIQAS